jgi:cytochrome c-type biogenesis protein CcmH
MRGAPKKEIERTQQNIAIARERLEGLRLALEEGTLSQEQFEEERRDLEAGLIDDIDAVDTNAKVGGSHRWTAVLVIVALPLISAGLYSYLGNPSFLDLDAMKASSAPSGEQLTIDEMVAKLEQRLEQDPENIEGWFMLNRTYMALQRYDQAVVVMRKVRELTGDQTGVLADLADAVAMKQGGVLAGEPVELLAIVLEREPQNVKALWLTGMHEYQQKNGAKALEYWYQLEPLLVSEPEAQQEVRSLISLAEKMAGVEPQATTPKSASIAVAPGQVVVSVDINPDLTRDLTGNETLFILARAKNGSPMPLAVARHTCRICLYRSPWMTRWP